MNLVSAIPSYTHAKPWGFACHVDSLDLDQDVLWQPGGLDAASGGLGLAKELGVDLVDGRKVVHVLDEDGGLEDVGDGRVGRGEEVGDVGEDLFLLSANPVPVTAPTV